MSLSASARWYRSALRNSSETGSPPMALRESTSSRISRRYSRERISWSRSASRTLSLPDRSVSLSSFACPAATRKGTYQLTAPKSRGFLRGDPPGGQPARGEEGVEDELGRTGQRAEVPQRRRQQGGRRVPAEPHQAGQVGRPDRFRRRLVHLGSQSG